MSWAIVDWFVYFAVFVIGGLGSVVLGFATREHLNNVMGKIMIVVGILVMVFVPTLALVRVFG